MAALKLALAIALALAASVSGQSQPDASNYVCPAGWIPIVANFFTTTVTCTPDPCVGACGAGNACKINTEGFSGVSFLTNTCTCNAPSVVSHVIYRDFCFIPGTDVCSPNPCKNGGTCQVLTDFSGTRGAYACICPFNFFGRNCDIIGPPPTAVPRGMLPGGPNPYTTF